MHYAFSSRTDTGRARANNEDALLIDEAHALAILADGMGGYNAGEVAAGMAVASIGTSLGDWLARAVPETPAFAIQQAMVDSVSEANRAILAVAQARPAYQGMGTTLVLAVFRDDRLFLGHIGDSRAYRWRGQQLEQLTRDHSLLQAQLDAGLLTPAEAAASTQRNFITRALGIEPRVELELHEHCVAAGDCFLLCSDGLTDMLADPQIAAALARRPGLARRGTDLVAAANAAGGRDNITVLLAEALGVVRSGAQQTHAAKGETQPCPD
ncbi:MAG: Stp1/IreP family PP2C-type Ser/Thr phosphatase [Betaproteobacteria bacterium]|nr:Stp1/IreP family PP2C-type Ser/Thr phosphatase [Betaproteobacteria bacterium]